MTVEKGKFLSQPVLNSKGVNEVSTSSLQQHREVKVVMTLQKRKKIDNKIEMPVTKMNQIVPVNTEVHHRRRKKKSTHENTFLKLYFLRG